MFCRQTHVVTTKTTGERFAYTLRETNGALGDLGTLLPLMLGAIVIGGLAPAPVLLGFAVFYIATALYYRLPIPVQPMKAVAAALLVTGMSPETVAVSGVIIGLTLLVLGWTGWINRLARLVPQSVLAGLQLGLGVALALMSMELMATAPLIAGVTLVIVLVLMTTGRCPAILVALAVAMALAQIVGAPQLDIGTLAPDFVAIPSLPSMPACP
jgi:predicted benzoate:H+ symporter BenE